VAVQTNPQRGGNQMSAEPTTGTSEKKAMSTARKRRADSDERERQPPSRLHQCNNQRDRDACEN